MTEAPLYTGIEAVVFLLFFGDNVSRRDGSRGSCSAWETANYLPRGRNRYLGRGLEVGGNYTD